MGKEVLVTISGIQFADGEMSDPVEVITSGTRYEKNGKTYIIYDEVVSEDSCTELGEVVKNTIRLTSNQMDLVKRGEAGAHLVFEEGQSNQTYYSTPYGQIGVTMNTLELSIDIGEELIEAFARYELEINNAQIAECRVNVTVKG